MNSGQQIRDLRKSKGLNQKQLAQRAGISASYLCDIEKGRQNGSVNKLEGIAKGLEVSISEIFKKEV